MADFSTIARPYAKAIFELARAEKTFPDWSALTGGLAQAVADPQVSAAIGHPAVGHGQIADLLISALGGRISPQAGNLLRLLSEYGRLQAAPAIAAEYERLRAEFESRVDVEITTAVDVGKSQQDALAAAIGKRLERDVVVSWETNPGLIAGALIRAGDLVIDGSVRGELEKLQSALSA